MAFSVDKAYLEYFKCAAEGAYNSSFLNDRLAVTAMGAGTAAAGAFRVLGRVIHVIIEVAKVAFYILATVFTFGAFGNGKRLLDHCNFLCLDLSALIAQPLQVTIQVLATFAGLISPMIGYRLMQGGTSPLALITGAERKIWQEYKTPKIYETLTNPLKTIIPQFFKDRSIPQRIVINLLDEFTEAFTSVALAPLGYMKRFYLFGANPRFLTEKQKQLVPILVLNGNHSHQGSFLPLMHALKECGNERPVYSFTLYNTDDLSPIINKIESIRKQYGLEKDAFKIDLVGSSMGAYFIDELVNNNPSYTLVRRVITLGTPMSSVPINCEPFDVMGTKDRICSDKSILDQAHQVEIDTGHSGLLHDPRSLNTIIRILGSN